MKTRSIKKVITVAALAICFSAQASKPSTELYEGITKGDLERVKRAIDEGANVNKKISMKYPLVWALQSSHRVDIIKYLIDKGADVNASDVKGSILMQYAGFVETPQRKAQWLMDFYKKYNVDTVVDPKIYSSISEVTALLLDSKANPMYDMGFTIGTPLEACMAFGTGSEEAKAEFIKALITHKSNAANPNDRMKTAESVGANPSGFKMLDPEKHPTPLMYAIQKDLTKIALVLIEGNANVNETMNVYKMKTDMWALYNTRKTVTALEISRQKGNKEVEQKLLSAGAM